ncbi:MAG: hypothetical protein JOS17DRAFT_786876 [Linnemannia elongata]|nr:MAG: hypothetical protein JOS17DRAFT_786876 [Linnemannia elongata]
MEVSWEDVRQDLATKDDETSSSSLPSPSPELSHAQAWSHEHSIDTDALPLPSLELSRPQTWSIKQPFQQRPFNDKDNKAATTPTFLPSPPLDLSIGSPWIESETNVFDSLFESHTRHSLECGTAPFAGLELDASQSDFGHSHSISDSCTKSDYGVISSSMEVGAELNMNQPVDHLMASYMSAEDLVQALVTPISDLIKAGDFNDKATPATPLCVRLNDLFVETAAQDKKLDQGNPTTIACSLLPPPQDTVSAAAATARRVRFDMTPYIKLLEPTRVTGPPKEPDEEHIDDIMRNARWEYRWDKDLRHEHKLAKWASFNAHLHAAFPVDEDDEQATDEQQSNQFSTRDSSCSTKKRSIDTHDTDDLLADERLAKRSRVVEYASGESSSCTSSSNDITVDQLGVKESLVNYDTTIDFPDGADATNDRPFDVVSAINIHVVPESQAEDLALSQHPDFDEMIKDDDIGRSYRLFRWNLYYPALQTDELQEDEILQEGADDLEC